MMDQEMYAFTLSDFGTWMCYQTDDKFIVDKVISTEIKMSQMQ